MIDWSRAHEVFQTMQDILDVDEDYKLQGVPVRAWLTPIRKDMIEAMKKNPEQTEAFFDWFVDAIFYMRRDSNDLPKGNFQWKI